jgi:hypothetical protein
VDGKTIDVTGTNFVDLGTCGNSLVFKLLNNKTHVAQEAKFKPVSSTEVVVDYPSPPAGVTWNVLVGYRDATGKGVPVTSK